MLSEEQIIQPQEKLKRSLSPLSLLKNVWRTKALWLGLIGLTCALYGQKLVVEQRAVTPAIRWYAVGILLVLVAWLGTYKNKTFLSGVRGEEREVRGQEVAQPPNATPLTPRSSLVSVRYGLALLALGLNLFSVSLLRADYYSALGSWGWIASLLLLLGAFVGYKRTPALKRAESEAGPIAQDEEARTGWHISRKLEIAIVLAILALGFFMRFYRLGDWTTGVFGDEGEAGVDALEDILGRHASPFVTGWSAQYNFYYWGIAIGLKLFGVDLFGLRFFSAMLGWLMLLPFYPLVRIWFGVRAALIATLLLAISDIAIHFSKIQLSNIATPFALVTGFYFLVRGLHNRGLWEFVLSGYGFMFGMYFYGGGRLAPLMMAAVLVYLFVVMPVVRLPAVYHEMRERVPSISRLRAVRQAAGQQIRGVFGYASRLTILAVACICFISPWVVYYLDHKPVMEAHAGEVLIFNQIPSITARYADRNLGHDPLYVGLRMPRGTDIYPVLPVVFEQTSLSVKLTEDGFWQRVLWNQLTSVLSVLTLRGEGSGVYTFTQEPVAKPIEAVLIVLGIAWSVWRWRDTRMGVLLIWFWSTVLVGGMITVDAPNMARLVGIMPLMAIFAAITLDKFMAEFTRFSFGPWRNPQVQFQWSKIPLFVSVLSLVSLLAYLTWQNYNDYYGRYLSGMPFSRGIGQAAIVREMNTKVMGEGRPMPLYYALGMDGPVVYWGNGVNRFLNHDVQGYDLANPAYGLPVINNGDKDVIFLLYKWNSYILPTIKAYYPDGEEGLYKFGRESAPETITYYRVKKEQLDARRYVTATYTSANAGGVEVQREESNFGVSSLGPADLTYPVSASWKGQLVAPAFGRYRFRIESNGEKQLTIDGLRVIGGTQENPVEGEVILARGLHNIELSGTLMTNDDKFNLTWASKTSGYLTIPRAYLWTGPGRGLAVEVRHFTGGDPLGDAPPDTAGRSTPLVIRRQIDGLPLYTSASDYFGGQPFTAIWKGKLNARTAGQYSFETFIQGASRLLIDDIIVTDNPNPTENDTHKVGVADLKAGLHNFELRYNWTGGNSHVQVSWMLPNGDTTPIGPESFQTDAGAWLPDSVTEPPVFDLSSQSGVK